MKRLPITLLVCLFLIAFLSIWAMGLNNRTDRSIKVSSAKGGVIGNQMLSIREVDQVLMNLALNDDGLGELLEDRDVDLISALPVGVSVSAEYPTCADACTHLRFYNYTDGGTIEAIYNGENAEFVASWIDLTARPNPSAYLVQKVVDIAADDERVREVLGDLRRAKVAMIPMSTWLGR